ncbi:MAG: AhpC/TSA family protein [Hydrotalea flava]|nr:AhpC/TSA family protein [Hydrotalea flava]
MKMKTEFLFLIALLGINHCLCQGNTFFLNGSIKGYQFDSAELMFYKSDSNFKIKYKKVAVVNNKFEFEGVLPYTFAAFVRFCYKGENINRTDIFFIDMGTQNIDILHDSLRGGMSLVCTSKTCNEFFNSYNSFNKESEKGKIGDDSTLFKYTRHNPSSYIALWMLLYRLTIYSYKPVYKETYYLLDTALQKNLTGLYINNILQDTGRLTISNVFPNIRLHDLKGVEKDIKTIYKKNKFVLVDFWFSRCQPCVRQFPKLMRIYQENKNKQFQIVGIATDVVSDENNLNLMIKKYRLNWLLFWDKNSVITFGQLFITKFPTNFLLNNRGEIILKNVEPDYLEKYLSLHLQ